MKYIQLTKSGNVSKSHLTPCEVNVERGEDGFSVFLLFKNRAGRDVKLYLSKSELLNIASAVQAIANEN